MFLSADVGGYDGGGRGPLDDFWYGPIPGKTTSGVRVNDETAMRLAIVYACIKVISQDIAKVPLMLFRRHKDGSRERITDHPLVSLLRKPTRGLTAMDWRQRLQAHLLLRGNAYCIIREVAGQVIGLDPVKPDLVRVEVLGGGALRYHVRNPGAGTEQIYLEGEILHMRGLSLDGPLGLSPIDQMKESLGEGVAAQAYAASFFANDARPSIWLKHPTKFKDESTRKDWLSAFKRAFGGAGRFSPMLTEYGIEINQLLPVSHADLQFLELRKLKASEICSMYRVPPHKVAILDRSTNNNIEHQGIEYVTDCLMTWARCWEEALSDALIAEDEREELYLEFMLDSLMRGDTKSRFDAYASAIVTGGWLTRNEVRAMENRDRLEHLDEPLQPLNMVPAGSPPAAAVPGAPTPATPKETPPPEDKGAPNDDMQEARARTLELQARRRVLNREARALDKAWSAGAAAFPAAVTDFYAKHADFVADALVVGRAQAEAYCLAQCSALSRAIDASSVPALLTEWLAAAAALKFGPLPAPPVAAQLHAA